MEIFITCFSLFLVGLIIFLAFFPVPAKWFYKDTKPSPVRAIGMQKAKPKRKAPAIPFPFAVFDEDDYDDDEL